MYKGKRVTVVVPAHNEQTLIAATIAGIPEYIDSIVAVDDASTDRTGEIARELAATETRLTVITHERNQGVGGTVVDGYKGATEQGSDIAVVMAGDNQMDPGYLPQLLDKI